MLHKFLGREFWHPSYVGSISSAGWEAGSRLGVGCGQGLPWLGLISQDIFLDMDKECSRKFRSS